MNRNQALQRLRSDVFDVCILGGGATGTGCALDAQLRGLKTALIERDDFSAQTSSKSTKLVHGGVRYLEQAVKKLDIEQFYLVQKALKERKTVLDNAPFLAKPLALLTPCYTWWEGWYYAIGLYMYDWIAGRTNLAPSRRLSRKESLAHIPGLAAERLKSSVLYWDGQLDDSRYNLILAKTAAEEGAAIANHVTAIGFEKDPTGKLSAVLVKDTLSGEQFIIRANTFVNAAGPWADTFRQWANPQLSPRIRVSKGAHIVLPKNVMPGDTAMLIPETDDGRVIFAILWQGVLLVGTTDTETSLEKGEPVLVQEEVTYLLKYLNRYLANKIGPEQVQSGFAGVRPLLQASDNASTKELVRDHEVETDTPSGLLSIMGGKWTTYRLMAQDAIDAVCKGLHKPDLSSRTAHYPLSGARNFSADGWKEWQKQMGWPAQTCQHLWRKYGTHAHTIGQLAQERPELRQPLLPESPYLGAEVIYAVRYEMAITLRDVIARRLGTELVSWQQTLDLIAPVATLMAEELNWEPLRKEEEQRVYRERIMRYQALASGAQTMAIAVNKQVE